MNIEPGSALGPPSEEHIEWIERVYRIVLPAAFRELLGTANGAVPVERLFDQRGRERLIERFLPILDEPMDDAIHGQYDITVVATQLDTRLAVDGDQLGLVLFPFAVLFAGDCVCLDYRSGGPEPSVGVWDHERSEDFAPHVDTVAASFSDFLDSLRAE